MNSIVLQPHQDLIGGKSRAVLNQQVDTTMRVSVQREKGGECVRKCALRVSFEKGKHI